MAVTEGAERRWWRTLPPRLYSARRMAGSTLSPASFLFGWLWQAFTPMVAFCFSAGCALLASLLLKFWVGPGVER